MKEGVGLLKVAISCMVISLAAGCATSKHENGKRSGSGERQLNNTWAGKPYQELLETYGQPTSVMEYPNSLNTTVVVYRNNAKLPGGCSHAFTVNHAGIPTVVNYFCR